MPTRTSAPFTSSSVSESPHISLLYVHQLRLVLLQGQQFLDDAQRCLTRSLKDMYERDFVDCHDLEHYAVQAIAPCFVGKTLPDLLFHYVYFWVLYCIHCRVLSYTIQGVKLYTLQRVIICITGCQIIYIAGC